MERTDFFISYSAKDEPWAEWIATQLEQAGYSSVVQAWDIRPGANFVLEMERAMKASGKTLLLLSPVSLSSDFTSAEWAAAYRADSRDSSRHVIPIIVEPVKPSGLFASLVTVNLVGLSEEAASQRLLEAVSPGRRKPVSAPPFPGTAQNALSNGPPYPGSTASEERPDEPDVPIRQTHIRFFTPVSIAGMLLAVGVGVFSLLIGVPLPTVPNLAWGLAGVFCLITLVLLLYARATEKNSLDGFKIKLICLQRGWTGEELAKKVVVNERTLRRWKNGETRPSARYREVLDELLDEFSFVASLEPEKSTRAQGAVLRVTQDFRQEIFRVTIPFSDPGEFYGRERNFRELYAIVARSGSVSLVGSPGSGKTWLLQYFGLIAESRLSARIGYVDVARPTCQSIDGFVGEALRSLEYTSLPKNQSLGLEALEEGILTLRKKEAGQGPIVLCLDNFDALVQSKEINNRFFDGLRSLTHRDLSLVVSSTQPLIHLIAKNTSGKFFNMFNQITLDPFRRDEASGFLAEKGKRAGFSRYEQARLLDASRDRQGWVPLRLQIGGKLLLIDKKANVTKDLLQDTGYWRLFQERLERQYQKQIYSARVRTTGETRT